MLRIVGGRSGFFAANSPSRTRIVINNNGRNNEKRIDAAKRKITMLYNIVIVVVITQCWLRVKNAYLYRNLYLFVCYYHVNNR